MKYNNFPCLVAAILLAFTASPACLAQFDPYNANNLGTGISAMNGSGNPNNFQYNSTGTGVSALNQNTNQYFSGLIKNKQSDLQLHKTYSDMDAQKASTSADAYSNYSDQVTAYTQTLQQYKNHLDSQADELRAEMRTLITKKDPSSRARVASINSWLDDYSRINDQAIHDLSYTSRRLEALRQRSELDHYNASQDQQIISDDNRAINQMQADQAFEQRVNAIEAAKAAELASYGSGGYGWGGYGHSHYHSYHSPHIHFHVSHGHCHR